jgi:hypothetical protein
MCIAELLVRGNFTLVWIFILIKKKIFVEFSSRKIKKSLDFVEFSF